MAKKIRLSEPTKLNYLEKEYLNRLIKDLSLILDNLEKRLSDQEAGGSGGGGGGSTAWGDITGALVDQVDLVSALADKVNTVDLQELTEDLIGSSIIEGTGINIVYNDLTGKTTISLEDVLPYDTLIDDTETGIIYVGKAAAGTTEGSASWQIFRIDETASPDLEIRYADGVVTFNKIWNNRASYTY